MKTRFNFDAETVEDADTYMKNRAKQLLQYGFRLVVNAPTEYGVLSVFQDSETDEVYQTPYVIKQHRENKTFLRTCEKINYNGYRVLTLWDCKIFKYLERNGIKYTLVDPGGPSEAYRAIEGYYESKYANRSGLHYMNHIDEGLALLKSIQVEQEVLDAYCLHPIYQDGVQDKYVELFDLPEVAQLYAHEYAIAANSYLPGSGAVDQIPFLRQEVEIMLCIDKIQNRKDFELYNADHPNKEGLRDYFNDWFKVLRIPERDYLALKRFLEVGNTAL